MGKDDDNAVRFLNEGSLGICYKDTRGICFREEDGRFYATSNGNSTRIDLESMAYIPYDEWAAFEVANQGLGTQEVGENFDKLMGVQRGFTDQPNGIVIYTIRRFGELKREKSKPVTLITKD